MKRRDFFGKAAGAVVVASGVPVIAKTTAADVPIESNDKDFDALRGFVNALEQEGQRQCGYRWPPASRIRFSRILDFGDGRTKRLEFIRLHPEYSPRNWHLYCEGESLKSLLAAIGVKYWGLIMDVKQRGY